MSDVVLITGAGIGIGVAQWRHRFRVIDEAVEAFHTAACSSYGRRL